MQRWLERIQDSTAMLAGLGAVVLVVVAAAVFVVGNLLTDDGNLVSADGTETTSPVADGGDVADGPDGDAADGDGSDSGQSGSDDNGDDQGNQGQLDGKGQGDDGDDSGDADADPSDTTEPPSSTTPTTDDPVGISDFCEAPTRKNFDIGFASGESSSTTDGAVAAGEVDLYQLEVSQDQIITVNLGSRSLELEMEVLAPGGSVTTGEFSGTTISPTEAGIYFICVSPGDGGADADYTLVVSVIDDNTPTKIIAEWCGTSVNDRGDIRFADGLSAARVQEAVIRGERDLYRFAADEGQFVDLLISSLEENAVFAFRAPDGELLIDEVSDVRVSLAQTGTYEICVGGIRGNVEYDLVLEIT